MAEEPPAASVAPLPEEAAEEAPAIVVAEPAANPAAPLPMAPSNGEAATGPAGPVNNPLLLKHERLTGSILKFVPGSGGIVKSLMFEGELTFKVESIMPECANYEFKENEAVEFDVQSNERGRPHAVMLKPVVGRKPTECLGQRHRGYVRRFADRWGFLNAAAFDGDLFVHRDNLLLGPELLQDGQAPLRSGQAVEFDVALDDRGRTVAKQITTSAVLRPSDWVGRRLQGFVRSFQGAWGFLNSDRFAGDLFVHRDSLLPQFQGVELHAGTYVEFDVEKDHHKKGGKNRLVARQIAVLGSPSAPAQLSQAPLAPYGAQPGVDPMTGVPYGQGVAGSPYGQPMPGAPLHGAPFSSGAMNPGAPDFVPGSPYGASKQPAAGQLPPQQYAAQPQPPLGAMGYGQAPYPYAQPQYPPQPGVPLQQPMPPMPQAGAPPYGQQPPMPGTQPQPYGQPPMAPQPQMPQPQMPQQPYAQPPPYGQQPYAQPPAYGQLPYGGQPPYGQLPYGVQPVAGATPQPALPQQPVAPMEATPAAMAPAADVAQAVPPAPGAEQPQVLLHITTHDWEPDQSGQLRVRKGTLVNVSHRAAHGWVYAATVQFQDNNEPVTEGWVPQAVAKRVSLAKVEVDWPAEGPETLALAKGDLIAVSKEAERGWVYGERISPRREGWPVDGWLPKKVLKYVIM